MSDVFISYAREDQKIAGMLASALEAEGLKVWWDRSILVGESFDIAIERELEYAKAVIVLWSNTSIQSEWVKNEAASAMERNKLLPVRVDSCVVPLEFRRRQTADLNKWDGKSNHPQFATLYSSIVKDDRASLNLNSASTPTKLRTVAKVGFSTLVLILLMVGIYFWQLPTKDSAGTNSVQEKSQPVTIDTLAGTWTHHSKVTWTFSKISANTYSVEQTDPDKGINMRGTVIGKGKELILSFELLPAPVMKGVGTIQISADGREIVVNYNNEDAKSGTLVFRR